MKQNTSESMIWFKICHSVTLPHLDRKEKDKKLIRVKLSKYTGEENVS